MKNLFMISFALCLIINYSQTLYPSTPNVNKFTGFTGAQVIKASYD